LRNNVLKYALIVSLLMNLSFIGGAAYTHYRQTGYSALSASPSRLHGPSGSFCPEMQRNYLFEALSLKPEEVKPFQQKAALFHQDLGQKRQEVARLRGELLGLMRSETPDEKAMNQKIAQINGVQEDIQKTTVSHMLEFKSMLDKDRQKKFLDMVEDAMGKPSGAICPETAPQPTVQK
jgi:hypothetical protein